MNQRPLVRLAALLGVAVAVPAVIALALATVVAAARPASDLLSGLVASGPRNGAAAVSVLQPATLPVLASGSTTAGVPQQISVQIVEGSIADPQSWGFDPPMVRAKVGDTITWTNAGRLPHTVTAPGGAFDSGRLAQGQQWSFTPSAPGEFDYFCDLHSDMKGTLTVEGAPEATVGPAAGGPAVASPAASQATAPPDTGGAVSATATGRQITAQIVAAGYDPPTINAAIGDRITWTNGDGRKHTVTADDGTFDSGTLSTGGQWSLTVDRAGAFGYYCDFHPEMRGTIAVGGGGGAPRPAGPTAAPVLAATPISQPTATSPPTANPPPAPPAGGGQVGAQIVADGFNPSTINAVVGDRITWTNVDGRKHTVTADDASFDSGAIATGGQWSLTAGKAGTIPYLCDFHPEMRGTLVVAAAGSAPPPAPQPPTATTSGSEPTAPTGPNAVPTRAEITLSGSAAYPAATGRARYENTGTRRELRVEMRDAAALKRATVDVFVGGSKVGSMAVADNGDARLELATDKGATTIPGAVTGQPLEVRTAAGVVVASGRFP